MMSIRLRLTLLYSLILALTLVIFGIALYTIQAQYTMNSLKHDLALSGENIAQSVLRTYQHPNPPGPRPEPPPPPPLDALSNEQAFKELREREIVRVLDAEGVLVTSPLGGNQDALPLSSEGLQTLHNQQVWCEIASPEGERLLIYNRPVVVDGQVVFIVQVARPLTERDRSLASLSSTLIIASLLTTLIAFGIGWVLSGTTLRPIHRITQTAQAIGNESGANGFALTRRVDYTGPNDEIGQLATTFNSMLTRLQDAYQRVNQSLKMQRDFVADVSHELRTPLTTVRGNLALLRRKPPLPNEEQADILSDLVEESNRLIRLVNDLLVLARADAGQGLLQEPVPIRSVVEEACRMARQLDRKREIIENVQDVTALGDRDALKQTLLILLDNALKYSKGDLRVTAETKDEQVVISVCDDGPGIAPEVIEHLFDRFYRGDIDPSIPGFGLGLPIAKSLVEGQGGTISFESQVGCGSVVRVILPLAPSE
jgi:two-component system OmpR family sensor kinase